jgi:hypothetical protein
VVEPAPGADRAQLERAVRAAIDHIDVMARPDRIVFAPVPLAGRSRKVDKRALLQRLRLDEAC